MAASQKERVRATRLREKKSRGKASADELAWLATYDATYKSRPSPKPIIEMRPPVAPSVRGPQLEMQGAHPRSWMPHVHTTKKVEGAVDPKAHTWTPIVPPAPDGAPPPPPGTQPPPAAGTPLVDGASVAPKGDPKVAEKFATAVCAFTAFGIHCMGLLAQDANLPAELKEAVKGADALKEVLPIVHSAATSVAMKHGFRGVPYQDELILAAALGGSGLASYAAIKRGKVKMPKLGGGASKPAAAASSPPPTSRPSEVREEPASTDGSEVSLTGIGVAYREPGS